MKKYILTATVILITLGVIKYEIPKFVNKTYDGMIMNKNSGELEKISIVLNGELNNNIFSPNEFRGTIKKNKEKELSNYIMLTEKRDKVDRGYVLELDNQNGKDKLLGAIYLSNDFEKVYIHFKTDNSYFAAPAHNIEDAEKILKELQLQTIK